MINAIIVTGALAGCGAVLLFASGAISLDGGHPWFALFTAFAGVALLFLAIAGAWGVGA